MTSKRASRKDSSEQNVPVVAEVTPAQDAAGELMHTVAMPLPSEGGSGLRNAARYGGWILGLIVAVAIITPVAAWFDYNSRHITSNNATVRAHLAEVGTRLTGRVSHVNVEAGDRVVAGQVLVEMEDGHLHAEVQEAKADLIGLQRELEVERMAIQHERLRSAQREDESHAKVEAADAQTSAALIRAEEAKRVHKVRAALLKKGGAITAEDVRNAESKRLAAEAILAEARANLVAAESANENARLNREGLVIRESRVSVLESDVLRAEARLQRAEAQLDASAVRAPEDGAIVRRFVQPGGSVEVGYPIISMWLGREVWVEAWIDEDDIGDVRLGAEAAIQLHAFPDLELRGVVDKIGLVTDFELPDSEVPQPRYSRMRGAPVVGVRIRLTNPGDSLLPGLSAVVAIEKPAD